MCTLSVPSRLVLLFFLDDAVPTLSLGLAEGREHCWRCGQTFEMDVSTLFR